MVPFSEPGYRLFGLWLWLGSSGVGKPGLHVARLEYRSLPLLCQQTTGGLLFDALSCARIPVTLHIGPERLRTRKRKVLISSKSHATRSEYAI